MRKIIAALVISVEGFIEGIRVTSNTGERS